jgi:heme exporter protein C
MATGDADRSMGPMPTLLKALSGFSGALFLLALYMVWVYAPREAVMGDVQRVFYFHVAAGWVGALAFLVTAIAGAIYLLRGESRWDQLALSSVEIGVVFILINIVSGSIWAKPIWGTWWTWDPRLITATIMELIYLAYLMLRQGIDDPHRRARFGAVYGIAGFISVPITFLSIRLLRTIHPLVFGGEGGSLVGSFNMDPQMLLAFMISLLAFTFVFVTLLWHRYRLQLRAERLEQGKMKLLLE